MKIQYITKRNIIVSDEKIKKGEYIIVPSTDGNTYWDFSKSKPKMAKSDYASNKWVLKIIAGLPGLPSIDYNGFEQRLGVVDVKNLAENTVINYLTNNNPSGDFKHSTIGAEDKIGWFIKGFKAAQELYGKSMYSEEDVVDAWKIGAMEGNPLTKRKKEELLESLSQPRGIGIEIEMELGGNLRYNPETGLGEYDLSKPKITNNSIKIINVL